MHRGHFLPVNQSSHTSRGWYVGGRVCKRAYDSQGEATGGGDMLSNSVESFLRVRVSWFMSDRNAQQCRNVRREPIRQRRPTGLSHTQSLRPKCVAVCLLLQYILDVVATCSRGGKNSSKLRQDSLQSDTHCTPRVVRVVVAHRPTRQVRASTAESSGS